MSTLHFGATRAKLFVAPETFSVPISRYGCSRCAAESPAEYVVWGEKNSPEADRSEAVVLLMDLVERDHPHHKPAVYGPATLEVLKVRVGRPAWAGGS